MLVMEAAFGIAGLCRGADLLRYMKNEKLSDDRGLI